jgi:hypothetical protein
MATKFDRHLMAMTKFGCHWTTIMNFGHPWWIEFVFGRHLGIIKWQPNLFLAI